MLSILGTVSEDVRFNFLLYHQQDLSFVENTAIKECLQAKLQSQEGKLRSMLSRPIPDDGFDLLLQLLQFHPNKRLSALVMFFYFRGYAIGSFRTSFLCRFEQPTKTHFMSKPLRVGVGGIVTLLC